MVKDKTLLKVDRLHVKFHTDEGMLHAVNDVSFDVKRGESVAIVGESGCGKSTLALSVLGLLNGRNLSVDGLIEFDNTNLRELPRHCLSPAYSGFRNIVRNLLAMRSNVSEKSTACSLQSIRGRKIAMVFQDPLTSLNPYLRIGTQISEPLRYHLGLSRAEARERSIDLLKAVGIDDPAVSINRYPHEFSGGMRQRAMIAAALSCSPDLLIADEPTTALDVTVQAQILNLIRLEQKRRGMSLILITHDLGVVAGLCDRVIVMYGGRIVEDSSAEELYADACHPYTHSLLKAIPRYDSTGSGPLFSLGGQPPNLVNQSNIGCAFAPRCEFRKEKCKSEAPTLRLDPHGRKSRCHFELSFSAEFNAPKDRGGGNAALKAGSIDRTNALLTVEGLEVSYGRSRGLGFGGSGQEIKAVNGVSLSLREGETLGLVGESGCGKSTLARAIVGLVRAQAGKVSFDGNDLFALKAKDFRTVRRGIQLIFQDPRSSLNPRLKAWELVSEPLVNFGLARGTAALKEAERLMDLVGLDNSGLQRYPHEFSGGQCQRIGIARALALKPKVLICDEPVSSLDVSIQAQILNLLKELQARLELTLLFISHDLSVVRQVSDRVAVMYLGRIIESGDVEEIFRAPKQAYTQALLSAIPIPDPAVERKRCELYCKQYNILME